MDNRQGKGEAEKPEEFTLHRREFAHLGFEVWNKAGTRCIAAFAEYHDMRVYLAGLKAFNRHELGVRQGNIDRIDAA